MIQYDSKTDTLEHIKTVNKYLIGAATEILNRAKVHDNSKLIAPEKSYFDEETPRLKSLVFGSQEYKDALERLKPALEHHYANNSHHPQHYEAGIDGMDLYDIIEMFYDWMAAGERTKNGNFGKSITVNKERFNMSEQLCKIFENTHNRYHAD